MMKHRFCVGWLLGVVVVTAALMVAGCGGDGEGGGQQPQATGSITGSLIHGGTGLALGGINVSAGGATAISAADGTFVITGVPVGQQTLVITPDPNRDLVLPPGLGNIVVVVNDGQNTALAPIVLIDGPDMPPNPPS